MAADRGISLSKVSPKYLHSNSTSHTWAFSAFAELIDNAYDPDVSASELRIDVEEISGQTCLTFVDNGEGLDPDKLLKMLSFGFCEKGVFDDKEGFHAPIGFYGNGFKSGSMRLGKDAMVLTRQKSSNSMSVGLLSQTYLAAIGAETVLVPIVTWKLRERQTVGDAEIVKNNKKAILHHSVFRREKELLREFDKLREMEQSTKIIIYNLHTLQNGATELDLVSDPSDIRCSESQEFDRTTIDRSITTAPEYRKSLREYCSILFLKPRMKIYVREKKVQTRLISKSLSKTEKDVYNPSWLNKRVPMTFGFSRSQRHEEEHGVMMYHRNRLIKAYEKVGYQRQSSNQGVGVVGIVEADFLRPTHNKQDFNKDEKYNSLIQALGNKLNDYWNQKMHGDRDSDTPSRQDSWTWAQCDQCLKWRRLPAGIVGGSLPDKWFCYMNPDATHNRCDLEEEPECEDEALSRPTYEKTYKRELERKKSLEKTRKELEQVQKETELRKKERQLREKERKLEEKGERLRKQQEQQQQQQLEPHHLNEAEEDSARKISTLQEKLRESRQREEEQKRRILAVEQQKTSLEQARKRAEKLVQGIRVVPVQGSDTSPSTSGEPARKRFRLTHESGETIMAFSQPSSQPANVDTIGANTTEDNEERRNSDSEDSNSVETDLDTMMEVDQPMPAQNDTTLPDSPNNSNDGCSSRRRRRRGTGNDSIDSTLMEGQAAEIRELQIKLKNTEEELAGARKQRENTEKELVEARKQAENTEKELVEARKKAENTQKELTEARKQAENTEKELVEARKQAENTEKELAEARKQAENSEKEMTAARKQAENSEKEMTEARKQAENTEKELAEARKQAENSEKEMTEARKQAENSEKELERGEKAKVKLMILQGHVHKLLTVIFPDMDIGSPESVDATVANIIQLDEKTK